MKFQLIAKLRLLTVDIEYIKCMLFFVKEHYLMSALHSLIGLTAEMYVGLDRVDSRQWHADADWLLSGCCRRPALFKYDWIGS